MAFGRRFVLEEPDIEEARSRDLERVVGSLVEGERNRPSGSGGRAVDEGDGCDGDEVFWTSEGRCGVEEGSSDMRR